MQLVSILLEQDFLILNKDQLLFLKGAVWVMGEKYCIVTICLVLKQKIS